MAENSEIVIESIMVDEPEASETDAECAVSLLTGDKFSIEGL